MPSRTVKPSERLGSAETSRYSALLYAKHVTHTPFRHVKALESRSQLLDAALETADQANRRWEEARQLIEGLRVENATLRAALATYQAQAGVVAGNPFTTDNDAHIHGHPSNTHGLDGAGGDSGVNVDDAVAASEEQAVDESIKRDDEGTGS